MLSGACYDQFDKNAVSELRNKARVWMVLLKLKALMVAACMDEGPVHEWDWRGEMEETKVACKPGMRYRVRDEMLQRSWMINEASHRVFYYGLTGYRRLHCDMEEEQTWK